MFSSYFVTALVIAGSQASPILKTRQNDAPSVVMTFTGGPAAYTIDFPADGELYYISADESLDNLSVSEISATGISDIYTACNFVTYEDGVLSPNADGSVALGPPSPVQAVSCTVNGTSTCILEDADCVFTSIYGTTEGVCCPGLYCAGDKCRSPAVTSRDTTEASTTNLTTDVTYYQGGTSSAACSGNAEDVASGTLTAGACNPIHVYGLSVAALPDTACTFTLFEGSQSCSANATKSTTSIPAGSGDTCIETGVQDGGEFEKASGIWSCPSSTCLAEYEECVFTSVNGTTEGTCCPGLYCAGDKCRAMS